MSGERAYPGDHEEADVERAPICDACGVTKLPDAAAVGPDAEWVCENPDCEAYGT